MGFCALPNQGFTDIGGVIGTCRAFLEPVAAGSLKAQHTIKNEIGTPFRGSLSHFFVGAILQQPRVHPCAIDKQIKGLAMTAVKAVMAAQQGWVCSCFKKWIVITAQ